MVISGRAKAVIGALVCFFLLGVVLVTGSTKGWFNQNDFNGERAAARIQVTTQKKLGSIITAGFVTAGGHPQGALHSTLCFPMASSSSSCDGAVGVRSTPAAICPTSRRQINYSAPRDAKLSPLRAIMGRRGSVSLTGVIFINLGRRPSEGPRVAPN